ncbi:MAG: non-heme iron oxygenase ferredoxin subunit [Corynebacteriales bacterium]|nr:non-heme iron oxygenase ferredoxin subunit [Mycobacteriales bacterium]
MFERVCAASEITKGSALAVEVDDQPVAVVHADDGNFYAIHDVCSHAEVALSDGEIDGCTLECWLHGSRFDLKTGEPLELPATEPVPTYAVRVDGDDVLVDIEQESAQ